MRNGLSGVAAAAALALLAGCSTSETLHHEGVTSYAGDAIRANTVLQMVDPWQYGVQDTDLVTPAQYPDSATGSSGGSATAGAPTP